VPLGVLAAIKNSSQNLLRVYFWYARKEAKDLRGYSMLEILATPFEARLMIAVIVSR